MRSVYREIGRARQWLRRQLPDQNRQDNLILLVGGLAAGGVWAIACLWGLPS